MQKSKLFFFIGLFVVFPESPAQAPLKSPTDVSQIAVDATPKKHPSMDSDRTGSTFVPMDSWIYPALERLANLGAIPTQSVGIRPWTRQECRRQVREAHDILFGFESLDVDLDSGAKAEGQTPAPASGR